jgi:hypothetical protein
VTAAMAAFVDPALQRLTCVSLPVHLPVLARPLGPLFALEEPLTRQIVIEYKASAFSIKWSP